MSIEFDIVDPRSLEDPISNFGDLDEFKIFTSIIEDELGVKTIGELLDNQDELVAKALSHFPEDLDPLLVERFNEKLNELRNELVNVVDLELK